MRQRKVGLALALFVLLPLMLAFLAAGLWYWHGSPRHTIAVANAPVFSVTFSPDGQTLVTADGNGYIRLWEVSTRQPRMAWQVNASVYNLAFSSDGAVLTGTIYTGKLGKGKLRSWKADTGEELTAGGEIRSGAFPQLSPDGSMAARVTGKAVVLYDPRTGEEQHTLEGHPDAINCMAFSPDGLTLATGGGSLAGSGPHPVPWLNGDLRLWSVVSGKLVAVYNRHSEPILAVAFSPDGRTVASASNDGTVKLWEVRSPSMPAGEIARGPLH